MNANQAGAAALPTLDWPGALEALTEAPTREAVERRVLPPYLPSQRWFGAKARRVAAVRLADWAPLPTDGAPTLLTLFDVTFSDGATDLYFIPLGVTSGPAAGALLQSAPGQVLARLRGPGGEAVLHDALADEGARAALLRAVAEGREFATRAGRIRAFPTTAFEELRGRPDAPLPAALREATSSNSLVLYGDRLLLKLFRRLEVGVNPDYEIGRFLTEKSGFDRIPRVAGALEYDRPGADPVTLALLQALVRHQSDGWVHALDELARYYERASARPDAPGGAESVGPYLHAAALLGRRTGELHLALADDHGDPAFTPEPLTPANLDAVTSDSREQVRQALAALQGARPENRNQEIEKLLESLTLDRSASDSSAVAFGKIRCHGDFHLGQVLWASSDFVLLDFEGEPTRTIDERRRKQSPLKDVAGMLRSFDYAANAGLFAFTRDRPDDFARLAPWAESWRQQVSDAFLGEYRATAGKAAFLPQKPSDYSALLGTFVLNKALYELVYELNNRPDWVRIPVQGILALMGYRSGGSAPTKG